MTVYELVNEKVFSVFDQNVIPWKRCWQSNGGTYGNPVTKHSYRGINVILCWIHNFLFGYSSPYFVTKKQLIDMGYFIKKGAKQSLITFSTRVPGKDEEGNQTPDDLHWIFRYYPVYNIEDTTIPAETFALPPLIENCTDFDFSYGYNDGPQVFYDGANPCYRPGTDTVHMPLVQDFHTLAGAQQSLFHELTHSTLKDGRVPRNFSYAKEELVAEIGASYLMSLLGMEWDSDNSLAYIDHWRKKMSEDPKLLVIAAGKAQEAVDFIMNKGPLTLAKAV